MELITRDEALILQENLMPIILMLTLIGDIFLVRFSTRNDVHPMLVNVAQHMPSQSEIDFADCSTVMVIWVDKSPLNPSTLAKESKAEFVNSIH